MKTAQHIFEEWQKLMVAGKNWRHWEDLQPQERIYWHEIEAKQNKKS